MSEMNMLLKEVENLKLEVQRLNEKVAQLEQHKENTDITSAFKNMNNIAMQYINR